MKILILVSLLSMVPLLSSCDNAEVGRAGPFKLCDFEIRNAGNIMIEEVVVDVGNGPFSIGLVGVSASKTLGAFRMPKNAALVHLKWSFGQNAFVTNSVLLPNEWKTIPYPKVEISISNMHSGVKLK